MIAAATIIEALGRGLPGDRLVVDPDVLAAISHDEAEWAPAGTAAAGRARPDRGRGAARRAHLCRIGRPGAPNDSAGREAAQAAFEEFLDAAIALGGTVTGEHGVGILKRDGMRRELDPGSLALQAAVRGALDPREIFNPGKG